ENHVARARRYVAAGLASSCASFRRVCGSFGVSDRIARRWCSADFSSPATRSKMSASRMRSQRAFGFRTSASSKLRRAPPIPRPAARKARVHASIVPLGGKLQDRFKGAPGAGQVATGQQQDAFMEPKARRLGKLLIAFHATAQRFAIAAQEMTRAREQEVRFG